MSGGLLRYLLPHSTPFVVALIPIAVRQPVAGKRPCDGAHQSQRRDALHIAHHTFPSVLLPLTLGLLAAWQYPPLMVFPLALLAFYGLGAMLRSST